MWKSIQIGDLEAGKETRPVAYDNICLLHHAALLTGPCGDMWFLASRARRVQQNPQIESAQEKRERAKAKNKLQPHRFSRESGANVKAAGLPWMERKLLFRRDLSQLQDDKSLGRQGNRVESRCTGYLQMVYMTYVHGVRSPSCGIYLACP